MGEFKSAAAFFWSAITYAFHAQNDISEEDRDAAFDILVGVNDFCRTRMECRQEFHRAHTNFWLQFVKEIADLTREWEETDGGKSFSQYVMIRKRLVQVMTMLIVTQTTQALGAAGRWLFP